MTANARCPTAKKRNLATSRFARNLPLKTASRVSLLYFNEPDLRDVTDRGVAAELRNSIKSLGFGREGVLPALFGL